MVRKHIKPLQVDSRLSLAQFLCFRLGGIVVVSIVGCDRDVVVAIELVVAIKIGEVRIVIHVAHNLIVRGLVLISSSNSSSPPLSIYHELAIKLEKEREQGK